MYGLPKNVCCACDPSECLDAPSICFVCVFFMSEVISSFSHLQFGFKKGMSTTQCTYSILEKVNYYNYNKSNVFVLMLDASKAFDRVN